MAKPICKIDGCERDSRALGCCDFHYRQIPKDDRATYFATHAKRTSRDDADEIPAHILAQLVKMPNGGCWLFQGTLNRDGYASYTRFDRGFRLHRKVYEAHVGPIPEGLTIDHLCRVRHCSNPEHLEVVTQAENNRRAGAAKTHCIHGHEYTPENTGRNEGRRTCKTCQRIRTKARYYGVTPSYESETS